MLERMIESMLRECETEEEFNNALDELREYIDMLEYNIANEKEWFD